MDWLPEYVRAWARHGIHFGMEPPHLNIIDPARSARSVIVEDECLIYRFPHAHRSREKRGCLNDRFLNPASLLRALDGLPEQMVILLPIPRIHRTEGLSFRAFVEKVDRFLGALPPAWRYALELHNPNYILPEYFECLHHHQVAHVIHDAVVLTADFGVIRNGGWSEIVHAVRQAVAEKRSLYVYVGEEAELPPLMEQLNHDLRQLSPIKNTRAA